MGAITVFVADDSVFIREGVKAMLSRQKDLEIVGEAEDFDGLVNGAESANPNVVVSDIRMPPNFHREGIEACKLIRKRHPGTGIVILSQYDDPDYAIALLSEGAAGYAYLLKDRIAEGDQLARAIREVASGGSMLDPAVVSALVNPVRRTGGLDPQDDVLLEMVAEGKPIKAIAAALQSTPAAVESRVETLFVRLAEGVTAGTAGALDRLKRLHSAIVSREEQGESLSRLQATGVADRWGIAGFGVRNAVVSGAIMAATAFAPWVGAALADALDSYATAYWVLAGGAVLATVLITIADTGRRGTSPA
jgi:DNA-binding NarL/FixJ family response regulator